MEETGKSGKRRYSWGPRRETKSLQFFNTQRTGKRTCTSNQEYKTNFKIFKYQKPVSLKGSHQSGSLKEGRAPKPKPSKTVSKPLCKYILEGGYPYRKRILSREAKAKGQQIQIPVSCRYERATDKQYKGNCNSCSFGNIMLTQKTLS